MLYIKDKTVRCNYIRSYIQFTELNSLKKKGKEISLPFFFKLKTLSNNANACCSNHLTATTNRIRY